MSTTWKTAKPHQPGWYWMKQIDGKAICVEVIKHYSSGLILADSRQRVADCGLAWAGPLKLPTEPSQAMLATVRYKLHGTYAPPRTHYYGAYEFDLVPRAEMLRRAKVHLCGDKTYYNQPVEADSTEVTLYTNRRVGGRWQRRSQPEVFTVANIDAAIAAESAKRAA